MLRLARKFLGFRIMSGCQRRFVRQTERLSLRNHTPYVRMNETSSVSCNTVPFVTQNFLFGGWRFRVDGSNSRLQTTDTTWLRGIWACVPKLDGRGSPSSILFVSQAQNVQSRVRYWMASAMCLGSIDFPPSNSAIVLATLRIRS